jgi:hypothetical protein
MPSHAFTVYISCQVHIKPVNLPTRGIIFLLINFEKALIFDTGIECVDTETVIHSCHTNVHFSHYIIHMNLDMKLNL